MATARLTLGSILGTVNETANMLTSTIGSMAKGVGMLDVYVTDAAHEQSVRSIANGESVVENVIKEKAAEDAIRNIEVVNFCKKSEDHAAFYKAAYDRYAQLLRKPVVKSTSVFGLAAE